MRPRCEFAASTAAKGFCTTACSAQPTRIQPTPRTIVKLRLFDTCNTAASDSIEGPPGKYLFGERKQPTRGTTPFSSRLRASYTDDCRENSVVQCGQRLAFTGILIAQSGQSFVTGSACLGKGEPLSALHDGIFATI